MSDRSEQRVSGQTGIAAHRFEQFIDKRHRVYVNRNLRMSGIRWVGFDLDHTLALYNRNFIEALAFDLALKALTHEKGYADSLQEIRYDPFFGIRGLVVDKKMGNILKMDRFHYASEAYHGKRSLDKEERRNLYTSGALQLGSERFWSNDTLFGLPEIALYASVVDALEQEGWPDELSYKQLFDDIRYCVDLIHKDGSLKSIILDRISECFLIDPKLPDTLYRLRREDKKLFLLTNSDYAYTDRVLSVVLETAFHGRNWWEFFDLIVTDSNKPDFFLEGKRWKKKIDCKHDVPAYGGGNFRQLEREMGARGDEILYIGDHIFGDILRSKKSSGWRTMMVVEELEHEIRAHKECEPSREALDKLQMANGEIMDELSLVRAELESLRRKKVNKYKSLSEEQLREMDTKNVALNERTHELDIQLTRNLLEIKRVEEKIKERFNPYWGSLCKVDMEFSRFGGQMSDFACVYTGKASNLLYYPPGRYFRSPEDYLPHEIPSSV
jgi:5'-nucleotidase